MSSASTQTETYRCSHCGGPRTEYDSVHGSYCSERCYYREKGQNILNKVDSQHHICSNCYGQVRETTPVKPKYTPGPDHPGREDTGPKLISDATQHPTELTTWGVDDFSEDEYQPLEGTRWSCNCGAVNPNETHRFMQRSPRYPTRKNLLQALRLLHDRDAIPHAPDGERFLEALEARYQDLAYAVGRAVYG